MVLAQDGYLAARVTVARPLESGVQTEIEQFLRKLTSAEQIELTTAVDADLLGGIHISTPSAELDATLRSKLTTLAAQGGRR